MTQRSPELCYRSCQSSATSDFAELLAEKEQFGKHLSLGSLGYLDVDFFFGPVLFYVESTCKQSIKVLCRVEVPGFSSLSS